jgi:hypothetical protein
MDKTAILFSLILRCFPAYSHKVEDGKERYNE